MPVCSKVPCSSRLAAVFAAGQDEVGPGGQQDLQVGLFYGAQIGHCIAQPQIEGGPGVVGRGHQGVLAAGQAPHIGKAAR